MKLTPPPEGQVGAEATDVDLKTITVEEGAALRAAVYRHKLVVFRDQTLDKEEYIAFARKLGRLQVYFQKNYHHPQYPEIFVSSNVPDENGNKVGVAGTGQYWHSDYQFSPEPLSLTLVYPQVLPSGKRETYYIDMVRVYEGLPADLRRVVDGQRAVQEGKWRYKVTPEDVDRAVVDILAAIEQQVPAITHPAVIDHPVTGRSSLYVSSGFTTGIEGLSYEENRKIMPRLFSFIEREEHVHTHTWRQGDILFWDNRTLLHQASKTPKGQYSSSYRIGVYDDLPFYTHAPALAAAAGA